MTLTSVWRARAEAARSFAKTNLRMFAMSALSFGNRVYRKLLGERYSQGAWVVANALIIAISCVIVLPIATFLRSSPEPLITGYGAAAVFALSILALTLVLVFGRRLQDQNINGLWAFLVVVACPVALSWAAEAIATKATGLVPPKDYGSYYEAANGLAVAVCLVLYLTLGLRGPREASKYGERTTGQELLKLRHPLILTGLLGVSAVAIVAVYAGLLQDRIWVRRDSTGYVGASIANSDGRRVLLYCGNTKGVSAYSTDDQLENDIFTRDAVGGTWVISVLRDGSLDIESVGDRKLISYRNDGFSISAPNMTLDERGQLDGEMANFTILARSDEPGSAGATVLALNVVKRGYGTYRAVFSQSRSAPGGGALSSLPFASGFVMLADCQRE
jgi:uncharacterized membrane protein YhaH (DUF805 family)